MSKCQGLARSPTLLWMKERHEDQLSPNPDQRNRPSFAETLTRAQALSGGTRVVASLGSKCVQHIWRSVT